MVRNTYVRVSAALEDFFRQESAGGIVLVLTGALAILMANTPLEVFYSGFLHMPMSIQIGSAGLSKTMHHWINDGLMVIFFFLIGLEIKRELLAGELSSRARALLPALAALGGMAVPAAVYYFVNAGSPDNLRGWAIPTATDIAFALGILSLLGRRVPAAVKVLLMAIAVIDDLGAIVVIALFYTADLSFLALALASVCIGALFVLNRLNVTRPAAYILVGVVLWLAVLKSGVHATLSGVITALFIPMSRGGNKKEDCLLEHMTHQLHPWVAFLVMPAFAFANAGVSLAGLSLASLAAPLPLGILAGLFIGKQAGVFLTVLLAVKTGVCPMPQGIGWRHVYGMSLLCGVGFTMSLFIGSLAFTGATHETAVRLGVLAGSLLSSVAGYVFLRFFTAQHSGEKA